ncbi:MAG: SDR family NAD(P)-dependent oxidoreductase [Terricaulis sp.]|nr:SDR family NAD(P)-dependent oxidoreductase [Terricaulis sp.]
MRPRAAQGADIVTIDHAPAPAGARAFGGVDLSDADAAQRAIDAAASAAGRIDALLNIAGGFSWAKTADAGADLYARMQARNLITALNASRAALAHLIASGGAIVNVVGAAGALKAGAGMGALRRLQSGRAQAYRGDGRRI